MVHIVYPPQLVRPGDIQLTMNPTIPEDWLKVDGSEASRTDDINLFRLFGTRFGSGDGLTTFNLPSAVSGLAPYIQIIKR